MIRPNNAHGPDSTLNQRTQPMPASFDAFSPDASRRRRRSSLMCRRSNFKQFVAGRASAIFDTVFGRRGVDGFGILMYHRIAPISPGVSRPTWNVTPDRFRSQLAGLLARGFQPLSLRDALELSQSDKPVPNNSFVVTFDDGYENIYTNAWSILRELEIPATVFVATAYLDSQQPFPFDDWADAGSEDVPIDSWRPLSSHQCMLMLDDGLIDVGTHTHTHADFRSRPNTLFEDIRVSLSVMRSRFGIKDATFAFPYGTKKLGYSGPLLAEAARQSGVLCSLTTESERVGTQSNPFDWGRFTAEGFDTAGTLAAKLDGWYTMAQDAWRKLRYHKDQEC